MVDVGTAWQRIMAAERHSLAALFKAEPDRLSRLAIEEAGIRFDFAKTHLSSELIEAFTDLATAQDFSAKREALFAGERVNVTEGRAAEHSAERGQGAPDSVARAKSFHARMRALIDAIEAEALGPIRHVLHAPHLAPIC
jgi:glucose-6-phosphate isomerase